MAWTLKLQIEVLEAFAEAQRAVDQTSGAISRWLWAREKRREIVKRTESRPERKADKYRDKKRARFEHIRRKLILGERPKRWGSRWREAAKELGICMTKTTSR